MDALTTVLWGAWQVLSPTTVLAMVVGALLTLLGTRWLPLTGAGALMLLLPWVHLLQSKTGLGIAFLAGGYMAACFGRGCSDGVRRDDLVGGLAVAAVWLLLWSPGSWLLQRAGFVDLLAMTTLALLAYWSFSPDDWVKTSLSLLGGILLGTVGIDTYTGVYRFAMWGTDLSYGIEFYTMGVSVLVLGPLLWAMIDKAELATAITPRLSSHWCRIPGLRAPRKRHLLCLLAGLLPGGVLSLTSLSRAEYQREGGAAGTLHSSSNAGNGLLAAGGAGLVNGLPLLLLGIPFSGCAVVLFAGLKLAGVGLGTQLSLLSLEQMWRLAGVLLLAYLVVLATAWLWVGRLQRLPACPAWMGVSLTVALVLAGHLVLQQSPFTLTLMLVGGIGSYFLHQAGFPLNPLLIGFVLGPTLERQLRQALTVVDAPAQLWWASAGAMVLWALCLAVLLWGGYLKFRPMSGA